MKKISGKTFLKYFAVFVLVLALLIGIISPIRRYASNLTFDTALAMNKAYSTVNIYITALSPDGKQSITPECLIVRDLDGKIAKGQKTGISSFSPDVKKIVPAKWVSMEFGGFDQKGRPIYHYIFIPRHFEIVVMSPDKGLIGSRIVSVIPNKAFMPINVKIIMHKAKFKKESGIHPMEYGGGSTTIVDYKTFNRKTKIAFVYSVPGEETWIEFKRDSTAYIQSKFRTSPNDTPPTGEWYDGGAVATPSDTNCTPGDVRNGDKCLILGKVAYVYEREKTVAYTNAGTFVTYRETVYPSHILDIYDDHSGAYIPPQPSAIKGNKKQVGHRPGEKKMFPLGGVSVYYIPAVTLNFGVSYGDGGGTVGVSVTLMLQRRYSQNAVIWSKVLTTRLYETVYAYDNGTNWGSIYFKWGN